MVSKASLLIGSNVRKSKARIAIVSLLCILSAFLLNVVFILSFDYRENFYDCKKASDGPDIVYNFADLSGTSGGEITSLILAHEGVKDAEAFKTYASSAEAEFGDGSLLKVFTFYPESRYTDKRLDRFEILESDESVSDGIYLSYIFRAAQNYRTGDKITITLRGASFEYTVKGFYNSVSTGTINCVDVACVLTDGLYDEILPYLTPMYRVSVICADGVSPADLTRELSKEITDAFPGLSLYHSQTVEETCTARYSNAQLFQTVLLVSGILIIAILLIMIAIVLSNYVKSNIVNLGTLKAMGYTSSSLILPILLEFGLIIALSSVIGVGGSYLLFPLINRALESQIGIPYHIRFIPPYALFTLLVTLITGTFTVYLSVRKIIDIEPINAIKARKNDQKTNNFFSLDKTDCELNTAIGLKNCLGGFSRNAVISVCYIMVSFLVAFSCFLYANVIMRVDDVIELVCGQVPDSSVSVSKANAQAVADDLGSDPDVADYYQYTCRKLFPDNGKMISLYLTEDNTHLNEERILITGRLPENDREVALNKRYATDNGLNIGDAFVCKTDEREVAFEVVGLTQGAYYTGHDGYMLVQGYQRIEELASFTYYVDLKDGCDIDAWNRAFRAGSSADSVTNEYKYFASSAKLYKNILVVLCVVIVALSLLISCFVLYVLISIILENKRREHGILKSLGFVTRDIVYQVCLSILPFAFLSTIVGTVLSKKLTDPILSALLNSIGIFRFGKEISVSYAIGCIVFMTAFTILYTVISSSPIKKITPHELFNKE